MDDLALMEVIDRLRNRFFGKYRGDGYRRRRRHDAHQGQGAGGAGGSADRLVPGVRPVCRAAASASRSCRRSGAGVWIEFEGGDVSYPIWTGCFWRDGEAPPTRRLRSR